MGLILHAESCAAGRKVDKGVMDILNFREPVSAWTHGVGLLLAVFGAVVLVRRSGGDVGKRVSLLVYGLSLIFCYAASTLYHGVRVGEDRVGVYMRVDSVGIFALIAGSYTPLAWNLMRGTWRYCTLGAVWGTAAVSAVMIASGRPFSPVVGTCVYLGMGWGIVVCYARVARVVSHRAMVPIVVGGVFYSVGAVLNVMHWPNLWPGVFGAHELFHLFVMAGSLAHYMFLLCVVVPLGRGDTGGAAASAAPARPDPVRRASPRPG